MAFLSKGGCGSLTWQMDNIDSLGGSPSNIFPVNWKVFWAICLGHLTDSMTDLSPQFLPSYSISQKRTHRKPPAFISRYLPLQSGSEHGLSVFPRKPEPLIINSHSITGKNVWDESLCIDARRKKPKTPAHPLYKYVGVLDSYRILNALVKCINAYALSL